MRVLERVPQPDGFYRDVMEVIMGEPIPAMIAVDEEEENPGWDDWYAEIRPDEADTGPLPRVG